MAAEKRILHYLGIALAVFIGVFAARMAYIYVIANVAMAEIEAIGEQTQENLRQRQEENDRQRERRRVATEQQRKRSKIGRDLYRRCAEYAAFHRDHPGDYAREQRDKACGNYNKFVETGARPR